MTKVNCKQPDCGKSFNSVSKLRKHQWVDHPHLYEKNKTPRVSLEISPPEKHETHTEIGFDPSEHHVIVLACVQLRNTLDSVLYKLKAMEAMKQ